jgi:hypothetical protein
MRLRWLASNRASLGALTWEEAECLKSPQLAEVRAKDRSDSEEKTQAERFIETAKEIGVDET